jgi:nitroimidazol reductase NimA-like FMN-containing flavoprotein (pyridoxamine 5'-phosphate oxidase superfamily)
MPKDYNLDKTSLTKMRRPEYACDDDWIVNFLHRAQIALFWYDPEQHKIYFHSNITGRVRANAERHPEVCFEASQVGKLLPSNIALEFGMQYESAIAFGKIRVLENDDERRRGLYGLIEKYFPGMVPGEHYRLITEGELKRTSVYAITIQSWSGKRNWHEQADQNDEWSPLGE